MIEKNNYTIKKANGDKEYFSFKKLTQSLINSGASLDTAKGIVDILKDKIHEGISTDKIHSLAFRMLKKHSHKFASCYYLKKGIMELGPTGYPFETFISYLFREKKYKTAILTAENTKLVERRANKMKIDFLFQGAKDKLSLMKELCEELDISLKEVIYIGDDINDKALLEEVGLAFKPANAQKEILEMNQVHLLSVKGGEGTIREIYNRLK